MYVCDEAHSNQGQGEGCRYLNPFYRQKMLHALKNFCRIKFMNKLHCTNVFFFFNLYSFDLVSLGLSFSHLSIFVILQTLTCTCKYIIKILSHWKRNKICNQLLCHCCVIFQMLYLVVKTNFEILSRFLLAGCLSLSLSFSDIFLTDMF